MTQPYGIMVLLFALMAVLAALDSSFSSWGLMPWFNGLRWLRVHFISLGLLTEMIFGLAPTIVAARSGRPRPASRWDIWLTLNAGLLILLIAIPLVNGWLIFIGGTAVFVAVGLLLAQLYGLRAPRPETPDAPTGLRFYLAGLSYLLLGIIVGTGLWLGWGPILAIQVPIEVHIHANNWGFLSLTFAGLMVDLYPGFAGRPRSFTAIFWMMTIGALLLVLGPWVKNELFSVPGIVLHLGATGWLLANMIAPIQRERASWGPGIWHLVSAYVWIIAPVLVAPLILLDVPGFPGAGIEQNAPQALIYGWVLQFGLALIPYGFARWLRPGRVAALGGSWLSLAALHTGSVLLWVSIFVKDYQGVLRGGAYLAWVVALLPLVAQLLRLVHELGSGSAALEVGDGVVAPGD